MPATATEPTVTTKLYMPWDPASSRRIWEACRLQSNAHNPTIEYLLDQPEARGAIDTREGRAGKSRTTP